MVKMTKYQIENKLIALIQNNDYENLELFFLENPTVDINLELSKKNQGLLSLSILNKSKECFDWILSHPKLTLKYAKPNEDFELEYVNYGLYDRDDEEEEDDEEVEQAEQANPNPNYQNWNFNPDDLDEYSDNEVDVNNNLDDDNEEHLNNSLSSYKYNIMLGINDALKHFNRAPNYANSYYLRALLNAGVYIYPYMIIELENYSDLYNLAIQNVNVNPKYLKHMLFGQVLESKSSRVIDTFEKVKLNLDKNEMSYLIKEAIQRKNSTWLKHFISHCVEVNRPIEIFDENFKSDILTFCIYAIGKDKNSLINPCVDVVLDHIKSHPLDQANFDAKYFVRNFLFGSNSAIIAKYYENLKQIQLPCDLSAHVKNSIVRWILNGWCQINYSNLNLMLKLAWCKTNVFDCLTNLDMDKIKEEVDSSNDYYRSNSHIKVFYQIAYVFYINNMDLGNTNSELLFDLFKFDESIYSTDLLKTWSKENLIDVEPKQKPIDTDNVTKTEIKKGKTSKKQSKGSNKKEIDL